MTFLRIVDAFSMLDLEPVVGTEVYSSAALVPRSVSDAKLIARRFGNADEPIGESRYKFLDAKILGEALRRTDAGTQGSAPHRSRRKA